MCIRGVGGVCEMITGPAIVCSVVGWTDDDESPRGWCGWGDELESA